MSLIIACDLSLNSSGICIIEREKFRPIHYESVSSDLDNIERLNYNYNRYMNLFSSYKDISIIAYEEQNPRMRFSYSAGSLLPLAENVGIFKLALYQSLPKFTDMPIVLGIPAQDIKKFATSNGNATKEEMIAAVNGTHIKSIRRDIPEHSIDDVADAYHLGKMAKELVDKSEYDKYLVKDYRVPVK